MKTKNGTVLLLGEWVNRKNLRKNGYGYESPLSVMYDKEFSIKVVDLVGFKKGKKRNNFWTLEKCKEDALMYCNKAEWRRKSNSAYKKAHECDWLDKCCNSMPGTRKNITAMSKKTL